MRISNLLSAACAAAFLTGSLAVRAQDTPAQAAARAALMQKMTEMDAQQSQPTNSNPLASVVIPPSAGQEQAVQPAVVTPTIPPPVVPPPATPEVAPVVNPPPPVIVVTPSGAQTVSQQQAPGSKQQPAVKPPAKPVKPVAKPVKPQTAPVVKPPPAKPVKPQTAPVVNPPPPANESYAGKTLGLKPIDAPPPPVSARKEAELQALLAKYMADQVTPDEYQKARAAILAEP
jgi:hypothetical protein